MSWKNVCTGEIDKSEKFKRCVENRTIRECASKESRRKDVRASGLDHQRKMMSTSFHQNRSWFGGKMQVFLRTFWICSDGRKRRHVSSFPTPNANLLLKDYPGVTSSKRQRLGETTLSIWPRNDDRRPAGSTSSLEKF